MTDAERMDKLLAGPTQRDLERLAEYKNTDIKATQSMASLFREFQYIHRDRNLMPNAARVLITNLYDEWPKKRSKLTQAYADHFFAVIECNELHKELEWIGQTQPQSVRTIVELYNTWISMDPRLKELDEAEADTLRLLREMGIDVDQTKSQ